MSACASAMSAAEDWTSPTAIRISLTALFDAAEPFAEVGDLSPQRGYRLFRVYRRNIVCGDGGSAY